MYKQLIIPAPFQIDMDDIGWWCGSDDRKIGGPSRTGMPRPHLVSDYQAIADLGEALKMKINCSLVLGEWDMDNRLGKEIPYFSHYGDKWNNKAYRNVDDMRDAVEIMNNSPYLDVSLHALYHGYYMPDVDNHDTSDFYYAKKGKYFMIPEDEVRLRLDHFFRLYDEHKMTTPIRCFISPSGAYLGFGLSAILKDYGIKYVATNFDFLNTFTPHPKDEPFDTVMVENDIITLAENRVTRSGNPKDFVEWDIVDTDFDQYDTIFGTVTTHWPNYLSMNPEDQAATLKKQLPYFRRCANTYGIVMSRDIGFAATQELFRKYSKLEQIENTWVIDTSEVPEASGKLDTFFISVKTPPAQFENCTLGEIQEKDNFINYEIKPEGKYIKISFGAKKQ